MGSGDLLTCEQCGNMGYEDSWPYVQARDQWFVADSQGSDAAVLCDECWRDAQQQKGGGDGQR